MRNRFPFLLLAPFQPLIDVGAQQAVDDRAQRDEDDHADHAHERTADGDGHDHIERRQSHRVADDMRIDQIALDLLDADHHDDEIERLHRIDHGDEQRGDQTAHECAEHRHQRGKADDHAA